MTALLFEISVVIPVFNGEKFIARAINSVLDQTFPANEIIVVDDGSTDNTAAVVRSYGDRVRYFIQKNSGPGAARNLGIKNASSQWIAFLDADDEYLPHKLQSQVNFLKDNPAVKWCSGKYIKNVDSQPSGQVEYTPSPGHYLLYQDYFQATLDKHHAWTGTVIAQKQVLLDCGLFRQDTHYGEDLDLWWKISYKFPAFGYCTQPLAIYYMDIHGSLACHRNTFDQEDSFLKRHLALALEKGCQQRFNPVAASRVNSWLRSALFDNRISEIQLMLKHYSEFIDHKTRLYYRLLTICPKLTLCMTSFMSKLNRTFKIRKKTIHLRA